LPTARL